MLAPCRMPLARACTVTFRHFELSFVRLLLFIAVRWSRELHSKPLRHFRCFIGQCLRHARLTPKPMRPTSPAILHRRPRRQSGCCRICGTGSISSSSSSPPRGSNRRVPPHNAPQRSAPPSATAAASLLLPPTATTHHDALVSPRRGCKKLRRRRLGPPGRKRHGGRRPGPRRRRARGQPDMSRRASRFTRRNPHMCSRAPLTSREDRDLS